MDYPTPFYSFLAFQFNSLLDQGVVVPLDEAYDRIADGSLLDQLLEQYHGEPYYLDLSPYGDEDRAAILRVFEALAGGVDAKRKLGVSQNGLALCLAYCIEVMQSPDSYRDWHFDT